MSADTAASGIRFELVLPCGDCLPVAEPPFRCTPVPEGWRLHDALRRRTVVSGETFTWHEQRYLGVSSAVAPFALSDSQARVFSCAIHQPEMLARAALAMLPGLVRSGGVAAVGAAFLALSAVFAFPPANARAPERSLGRESLRATHFLATLDALPRLPAPAAEKTLEVAKLRPKMPARGARPHTLEKAISRNPPPRDPRYFLSPGEG